MKQLTICCRVLRRAVVLSAPYQTACVAGCHVNYEKSGSSFERERQRRGKFQRRVVRAEAKATERATADRVRKAYRSHPA
ncbi:hypothetical protein PRIC1_008353 [Phytophthora ramorum]